MKQYITNNQLAKFIVSYFYHRIHPTSKYDLENYISKDISSNTGWRNFYDIELDNVCDWGFVNAYNIWKKLEKDIASKYEVEIIHCQNSSKNGIYTWQKDKKIKFNNGLIICLGSRMAYPRHPKECHNTVYITTNSYDLFNEIFREYSRTKNAINDKNHEIILNNTKYTTKDIVKSVKSNPKLLVNLIKDILDSKDPEKNYHEITLPLTQMILEKMTQVTFTSDLAKNIYMAAYIKSGGDGTTW